MSTDSQTKGGDVAETAMGSGDIILGTMRMTSWGGNLTTDGIVSLLKAARDAGVTCLDLADIYGGHTVEAAIGAAFAADPSLRDAFKLVSKFGILFPSDERPGIARKAYDSSDAHARASVKRTLTDLGVASLDSVLVHRFDHLTAPADLARTLASLAADGSARSVGVSNLPPAKLRAVHAACAREGVTVAVNQIAFSALCPDAMLDGTIDACTELGVAVTAYSPLGDPAMFASSAAERGEKEARVFAALEAVAEGHGVAPDAVAIAWVMKHHAGIRPIIGTTKPERVERVAREARISLGKMTRDEWYGIFSASLGREID